MFLFFRMLSVFFDLLLVPFWCVASDRVVHTPHARMIVGAALTSHQSKTRDIFLPQMVDAFIVRNFASLCALAVLEVFQPRLGIVKNACSDMKLSAV